MKSDVSKYGSGEHPRTERRETKFALALQLGPFGIDKTNFHAACILDDATTPLGSTHFHEKAVRYPRNEGSVDPPRKKV